MLVFRKRAHTVGQVPLAALIVFVALFVITAGLSYVFYQQSSKKQLELDSAIQAREAAQDQLKQTNDRMAELQGLFGWEDWNAARRLLAAEDPQKLQYDLPADVTHGTLNNTRELAQFLLQVRHDYLAAWQAVKEAFDSESEARRAAEIAREQAIIEREAQLQQQREQLEIQIKSLQTDLAELKEIHNDLNEKYVDEIAEKDKLADLYASLQKQAEEQQNQIHALEDKLAERAIFAKAAELEPDGEILNLDQQLGFAYINLGRNENVQPGWRFKVVRKTPRGYEAIGDAEVRRVEEKVSRVAVRAYNARVPVVKGDSVANPAYDPKKSIMFAFAGKLDVFTIDEAKKLTQIYGAKVADALSPYVDYLVIGRDPGDAEDQARRYGIAVMAQEQFLDYVGAKF